MRWFLTLVIGLAAGFAGAAAWDLSGLGARSTRPVCFGPSRELVMHVRLLFPAATDPRAGVPGLPNLAADAPVPVCRRTVVRGAVAHDS